MPAVNTRAKKLSMAGLRSRKSVWITKLIGIISLSIFLWCFLCRGIEAQSRQKIRIDYPAISSRQAQLWVAKNEGLSRKYGLDVELIFLRGGQVAIQALAGGDPQASGRKALVRMMPTWRAAQDEVVGTLGQQRWSAIINDLEQAALKLSNQ